MVYRYSVLLFGREALNFKPSLKDLETRLREIADRPFLEKKGGSGENLKNYFYRRIGMKNESVEQLNALKSCRFSRGAI